MEVKLQTDSSYLIPSINLPSGLLWWRQFFFSLWEIYCTSNSILLSPSFFIVIITTTHPSTHFHHLFCNTCISTFLHVFPSWYSYSSQEWKEIDNKKVIERRKMEKKRRKAHTTLYWQTQYYVSFFFLMRLCRCQKNWLGACMHIAHKSLSIFFLQDFQLQPPSSLYQNIELKDTTTHDDVFMAAVKIG